MQQQIDAVTLQASCQQHTAPVCHPCSRCGWRAAHQAMIRYIAHPRLRLCYRQLQWWVGVACSTQTNAILQGDVAGADLEMRILRSLLHHLWLLGAALASSCSPAALHSTAVSSGASFSARSHMLCVLVQYWARTTCIVPMLTDTAAAVLPLSLGYVYMPCIRCCMS
jgi:hypothetical protein